LRLRPFGRIPALCLLAPAMPLAAQEPPREVSGLSAPQVFEIAARAEQAGDLPAAEEIYTVLAQNPEADIRSEARFRHARLLQAQKRYRDAAVLLRAILDEKPQAQPARLELAKVLALMGDEGGARRALRQAQATGMLPADIARVVDQFAAALRSMKPFGGSVELALAPSSNINRATSATTLDTIIAPFELSDDARAQSGLGVRIGGQGYLRLPLNDQLRVTARVSGQASLYRQHAFDDVVGAAQLGLEGQSGRMRVRPLVGRSHRWFGGDLYATTDTVSLNIARPIGKRTQVEAEAGVGWSDYRLNDLQDGKIYDASLSIEHAFSARTGGSLSLSAQRQAARDAGYATKSGGGGLLAWHEWGRTTLYATASLYRLEADARQFLYLKRRTEWLVRASAGATLRRFTWHAFAPVVRVSYERNRSTVGIYDYRRFGPEIGISRAF